MHLAFSLPACNHSAVCRMLKTHLEARSLGSHVLRGCSELGGRRRWRVTAGLYLEQADSTVVLNHPMYSPSYTPSSLWWLT